MSKDINYFEITPPEIVEYILSFSDISIKDVIHFGLTSQNNLHLCRSFQPLWKKKLFTKWPTLRIVINKMTIENWFMECKAIGETQNYCARRIKGMEALYYWRNESLPQCDMKDLLEKSKERNGFNFHIMAEYLRRLCHISILAYDNKDQVPQYGLNTLTYKYYAEIVLDYLCHEHMKTEILAIHSRVYLPEEIGIIFIQWILPKTKITLEIFKEHMSTIVKKVESLMDKNHPLLSVDNSKRTLWSTTLLQDNQWEPKVCEELIRLISDTIFRVEKFAVTATYHWDNVNMEEVLSKKAGHQLLMHIIFEAIARRCGVRCDIVTTVNHAFLYWRGNWSEDSTLYVVNTTDGSLKPSVGRCPFAMGNRVSQPLHKYSHLQLMAALLLVFDGIHEVTGERMTMYCLQFLLFLYPDNTSYLMGIINYHYTNRLDYQPLLALIDEHVLNPRVPEERKRYCRQTYDEIVMSIKKCSRFLNRERLPKQRTDGMRFGIGLICRHRTHHYECVITDWSVTPGRSVPLLSLLSSPDSRGQLVYCVVAQDGSCRQVSEADLDTSMSICQLPSVESKIGKDFSHFNGFRYVPNEEKRKEYPDDESCCYFYQSRYFRQIRATS